MWGAPECNLQDRKRDKSQPLCSEQTDPPDIYSNLPKLIHIDELKKSEYNKNLKRKSIVLENPNTKRYRNNRQFSENERSSTSVESLATPHVPETECVTVTQSELSIENFQSERQLTLSNKSLSQHINESTNTANVQYCNENITSNGALELEEFGVSEHTFDALPVDLVNQSVVQFDTVRNFSNFIKDNFPEPIGLAKGSLSHTSAYLRSFKEFAEGILPSDTPEFIFASNICTINILDLLKPTLKFNNLLELLNYIESITSLITSYVRNFGSGQKLCSHKPNLSRNETNIVPDIIDISDDDLSDTLSTADTVILVRDDPEDIFNLEYIPDNEKDTIFASNNEINFSEAPISNNSKPQTGGNNNEEDIVSINLADDASNDNTLACTFLNSKCNFTNYNVLVSLNFIEKSKEMFPAAIDQSRQDNIHPQTVHVHMHQICTCMHPYYPSYRPPIMAPYHVQPVPRPYNLSHYQYTQFNLSPYNFPVVHTNNAIAQQPATVGPTTHQAQPSSLDFGPPPRDRRNFENAETPTQETPSTSADTTKDNFFDEFNITLPNLNDVIQGNQDNTTVHNLMATTEDFTKYLEQGCILAEKIAIRNQHRPCFKNIQNLCNRTRSEILKPSNTVSNIHSQGIPWATKDFIYAFVRLINCWHMLKGYLDSKDGTLGSIDRELTPEFKNCYLAWEKNTKELASYMILIFNNLDNNVSHPNAIIHKTKSATSQESPQRTVPENTQQKLMKENSKSNRNALLPQPVGENEAVVLSESTGTSPRDDDSDNESRVYMKPGSYRVPKKNNDSSNSSPSIEFLDTAQNVSVHYKKIAKKKYDSVPTPNDKMWQDAQNAVPHFMNKMISPQCENANKNAEELEQSALKYFIDLGRLDHGLSDIQEWINKNDFSDNQSSGRGGQDNAIPSTSRAGVATPKPVTVLQRSSMPKLIKLNDLNVGESSVPYGTLKKKISRNCTAVQSRTYRKRTDCSDNNSLKGFSVHKKSMCSMWEHEKGGLTANTIITLEDILKNLEKEEFIKYIDNNSDDKEGLSEHGDPTSILTIRKKLNARKYNYLSEFIHDVRNLISCAIEYENRPEVTEELNAFEEKFEDLVSNAFSNFDFSNITGDRGEDLGPIMLKKNKKSDGDGDH